MVDVAFEDLPTRAQVHRMRAVAVDALGDYPIEPRRIRLVCHAHNTTFRVDTTDGRRFALRVNLNSRSTVENLDAETAWLTALARDTDATVPVPLATHDGALHTSRWCEPLERALRVAVMSWLPGRDVDPPTDAAVRELGRTTAILHDHGARWTIPPGAAFPSNRAILVEEPNRLAQDHPLLTDRVRETVDAAMARAQAHYDALHAREASQPLHADLHGGNAKWYRGRVAVFDFDDAVVGAPALDLGISAYYLRSGPVDPDVLLEGYTAHRSLPRFDDDEFEALLVGRNLLLLNEVLGAMTAEFRTKLEPYVSNTVRKLDAYLDSGVYRHDVPGLVPIAW